MAGMALPNSDHVYRSHAPTFVGGGGAFFSGPTTVSPSFGTTGGRNSGSHADVPANNPHGTDPFPPIPSLSSVACEPLGPGCAAIDLGAGGATTVPLGLHASDSQALFPAFGDVEPPDQGLCAGNGNVMEMVNIGVVQVYDSGLSPVSGLISLNSLLGLDSRGWVSEGDVICMYDPGNGGHWFVTEIVSTTTDTFSAPGCLFGVKNTCLQGLAVSVTNDPLGAYNVYFLDPNKVNNDTGVGFLLNDFAKLGNTRDALLLFYDEVIYNPSARPACPAHGCVGLDGAQEFAINKNALERGLPVSDPTFNVAYEDMGTDKSLYPIPANGIFQPGALDCAKGRFAAYACWIVAIPAQSPSPAQFDDSNGGTGFIVAHVDKLGLGDNRMAVFDWTGLSSLGSSGCATCAGISFGGRILGGLQMYRDQGAPCKASSGLYYCGLAPQKAGPVPLGANCAFFSWLSSSTSGCPEGGIAGSGVITQVYLAQRQLWFTLPTLLTQTFSGGASEIHVAAAYWVIGTDTFDSHGIFTVTDQAYVAARHEDIVSPSMAADGSGALLTFTLLGDGGPTGADGGGFYPSAACGKVTSSSHGLVGSVIHIADLGMSPQDGWTEYYAGGSSPRWGDYSAAVFDPVAGRFYFATEYIQHPNCSPSAFLVDQTCGGTRLPLANWGTSVNSVSP